MQFLKDTTFPRIELGHGPDLDKIANEFPQVFDNTKIPTMAGGYYVIDLEDGAVPFNKGSSRTVPEPSQNGRISHSKMDESR